MELSTNRLRGVAEDLVSSALVESVETAESLHIFEIVQFIESLEELVEEGLRCDAATRIQAATLAHFARRAFLLVAQARQRAAAIVQAVYRRRLDQRRFFWGKIDKYGAILIQTALRSRAAKRKLAELRIERELRRASALVVQTACRRRLARKQLGPLRLQFVEACAALVLQAAARRRLARLAHARLAEERRVEAERRHAAAFRLQTVARTLLARAERSRLRRQRLSVVMLQACVRRRRAVKRAHAARVLRVTMMARKIVAAVRAYRARAELRLLALQKVELERWCAAAIVQAAARRALARALREQCRADAVRRHVEGAAATIQAVVRRGRARVWAGALLRRRGERLLAAAAICIQAFGRMGLCKLAARVMRRSSAKYWEVMAPQPPRPATRGSAGSGRPFTPASTSGTRSSRSGPRGATPPALPPGRGRPPVERLALALTAADVPTPRSGADSLPPLPATARAREPYRPPAVIPRIGLFVMPHYAPVTPLTSLSRRAGALGPESPKGPPAPLPSRPATSPLQSPSNITELMRPATSPEPGMRRALSGPVGRLRPLSRERPLSEARSTHSLRGGPQYVMAAGGKVRRKTAPAPPSHAWPESREEAIIDALWQ